MVCDPQSHTSRPLGDQYHYNRLLAARLSPWNAELRKSYFYCASKTARPAKEEEIAAFRKTWIDSLVPSPSEAVLQAVISTEGRAAPQIREVWRTGCEAVLKRGYLGDLKHWIAIGETLESEQVQIWERETSRLQDAKKRWELCRKCCVEVCVEVAKLAIKREKIEAELRDVERRMKWTRRAVVLVQKKKRRLALLLADWVGLEDESLGELYRRYAYLHAELGIMEEEDRAGVDKEGLLRVVEMNKAQNMMDLERWERILDGRRIVGLKRRQEVLGDRVKRDFGRLPYYGPGSSGKHRYIVRTLNGEWRHFYTFEEYLKIRERDRNRSLKLGRIGRKTDE